jgi:hypothetical protein
LKNANNFAFPDLDLDKKQRLVTELFTRIRSFNSNSTNLCLKTLRLLTREREGLDVRKEKIYSILNQLIYDLRRLRDHRCLNHFKN